VVLGKIFPHICGFQRFFQDGVGSDFYLNPKKRKAIFKDGFYVVKSSAGDASAGNPMCY